MSFMDSTLESHKSRQKVIGPKVHGMIDYAHVAFFFTVALLCRKNNKPAAVAALCTGSFVLAQSLLTDYPLGVKPLIPFEVHGKMDVAFASASWVIPKVFGFSGTKAAKIFETNSAVEGTVAGMTDFSSQRAHDECMGA